MKEKFNKLLEHATGYRISVERKISSPFRAQKRVFSLINEDVRRIIDAGAYKGNISDKYLKLFSESKIYCFEPFEGSFKLLKNRFENNGRVKCIQKALSETNEKKEFYINEFKATNSTLPRPSNGKKYYKSNGKTINKSKVNSKKLDDFVEDENLKKIDILKMDIQGGELNALKGAKKLLKNSNVKLIYTEVMLVEHYEDQPLLVDIWNYLNEFGYSFYNVFNIVEGGDGQMRYGDVIFLNRNVKSKIRK